MKFVSKKVKSIPKLMTAAKILAYLISKDTQKVWEAACAIIAMGQDHTKIEPFISHLPLIQQATANLKMGGAFAPNQRFIDFALKTIEFHRDQNSCTCALYTAKYTSNISGTKRAIQYESFNPNKEVDKGNVKIMERVYLEGNWIDHYLISCLKCTQQFKVEEREGHYMFWSWKKV